MNKFFKYIPTLIVFVFTLSLVALSMGGDVSAATKPQNRTYSSTPTNTSLMRYNVAGNYRSYPVTATYINSSGTSVTQTLRETCPYDNNNLEKLPWLASYPNDPYLNSGENTGANKFTTDITNQTSTPCSTRKYNGGPGQWLAPQAMGGWAMPGDFDKNISPWNGTIYNTTGTAVYSDQLLASQSSVAWRNTLDTVDSEPTLFGNNLETTYPLLFSNGTGYFRNEINFTDEEWSYMTANPDKFKLRIKSRADDFQKVYLNGVPLVNYTIDSIGSNPAVNKAIYAPKDANKLYSEPSVTDIDSYGSGQYNFTQLVDIFGLQKTGNSVAFQVIDKAVWRGLSGEGEIEGSTSNAIGLWFNIELAYEDAALCTDSTATNFGQPLPCTYATSANFTCSALPSGGTAPMPVIATVAPNASVPVGTTYNYDFNFGALGMKYNGAGTSQEHTYALAGDYLVKASASYAPTDWKTCQPVGIIGDLIKVLKPSSGGGGEVAP